MSLTYETALERYLNDQCPLCGRKMEKREKVGDYYCHKCRTPWDGEKVLGLKKELPIFQNSEEREVKENSLSKPSFFVRLKKFLLG